MLTSSPQLQNRSFHFAERTRESMKCPIKENTGTKREKLLFVILNLQICDIFVERTLMLFFATASFTLTIA